MQILLNDQKRVNAGRKYKVAIDNFISRCAKGDESILCCVIVQHKTCKKLEGL